jgi:hypothetical protein
MHVNANANKPQLAPSAASVSSTAMLLMKCMQQPAICMAANCRQP